MEKKSYLKLNPKTSILLLLLVISVSFTLLSFSFKNIIFMAGADEGYYLKYATYIGKNGLSGFPALFKDYLQAQEHWPPNPLRVGFILLSSLWLKIFGYSFLNLAYLSLFSYSVFLCLSFYFVKKYFGEKNAVLAVILLAFSPLNMALARRALMNAAVNPFTLCSIWLFFERLRERKNYKTVLFIALYSLTILIREDSVLLSVFFMFYILIHRKVFKRQVRLTDFLMITVFPAVIVGSLYTLIAGGFSNVIETARIILLSQEPNHYALIFGSGPWYRYLIDFMLLSPWVSILAIAFAGSYFIKKEWREEVVYLIILSISLIFLLDFFTKNVRYLSILDLPLRLFAILMLNELTKRIFKDKSDAALIICVVLIVFFDFLSFLDLFIRQGIYDPVSYQLLQARHIIPWR